MALNFPINSLSKQEDDNLNAIDAFCNEVLLPRLNDGVGAGNGDAAAIADTVAFALRREGFTVEHLAWLSEARERLRYIAAREAVLRFLYERHRLIDKGSWFWIEGVQEELDQPGEWFLNPKSGRLFYMPPAGIDPNTQVVIAPFDHRFSSQPPQAFMHVALAPGGARQPPASPG